MKMFVTFGQIHAHSISGTTFDKDSVGVVKCASVEDGMRFIHKTLGAKYCFSYPEQHWNYEDIKHFTRGYIFMNGREAGEHYVPSIEADTLVSEFDDEEDMDEMLHDIADTLDADLFDILDGEEH